MNTDNELIELIKNYNYDDFKMCIARLSIYLEYSEYKLINLKQDDNLYATIIRKTKRFAIPERAVYFLKTKRTAGGTPPP